MVIINHPRTIGQISGLTDRLLLPIAAIMMLVLAGCGTTSGLQSSQGTAITSAPKFSKVSVRDFKVSVKEHREMAASSALAFPDRIASAIRQGHKFAAVARNSAPDVNTLMIDGVITNYDEGSTAKRIWLGMGFGMSFLEATVTFRDSKGNVVGNIKVDKNSWPLGGGIAASQNPHSFMDEAAEKIAEEAARLAR